MEAWIIEQRGNSEKRGAQHDRDNLADNKMAAIWAEERGVGHGGDVVEGDTKLTADRHTREYRGGKQQIGGYDEHNNPRRNDKGNKR